MRRDVSDESSPDGEIQYDVKRLIKWSGIVPIFASPLLLHVPNFTIEEPANFRFFPFDSVDMEVFGEVNSLELLSFTFEGISRSSAPEV